MGKNDPEASKSRKRQLNVIYFIDSARTRTITIPLGRLNLLLCGAGMVTAWSVASAFVLVWLVRGNTQQSTRLRDALTTIFEYETRDDKVFDVAYPPGAKPSEEATAAAQPPATVEPHLSMAAKAPPSLTPAQHAAAAMAALGEDEAAVQAANIAKPEVSAADAAPKTAAAETKDSEVVVGNPVLEAAKGYLSLRFELTNHSRSDRVEGLIWAVADFKTDAGEHLFIGAPSEIQVKADGEPEYPMRSTMFGIRRYKQKGFNFPFPANRVGTFTGVRIGVMSRSGADRTTYNVPVQIRAGQSAKEGGERTSPPAPPAPEQG